MAPLCMFWEGLSLCRRATLGFFLCGHYEVFVAFFELFFETALRALYLSLPWSSCGWKFCRRVVHKGENLKGWEGIQIQKLHLFPLKLLRVALPLEFGFTALSFCLSVSPGISWEMKAWGSSWTTCIECLLPVLSSKKQLWICRLREAPEPQMEREVPEQKGSQTQCLMKLVVMLFAQSYLER